MDGAGGWKDDAANCGHAEFRLNAERGRAFIKTPNALLPQL